MRYDKYPARVGLGFGFAVIVAAVSLASFASTASAQPLPSGLMSTETASEGKTDVAVSGFEKIAKPDDEDKDTTELKLLAGGLMSAGNSRAISITGAARFKLRRDANQFTAAAAANYARSAPDSTRGMETTLENLQGRARYDRFFTDWLAGFIAASGMRDRFQGLNLRVNIDPGLAFYVIDEKAQQLWFEVGYDQQYDIRRQQAIDEAAAKGTPIDKTETRYNLRGFVGYNNALSEQVTFDTGLEYIQGLQETKNWRLVWDSSINSNIGANFAIATSFTLKYDNNPLPSVDSTDAITAISLVYTLL